MISTEELRYILDYDSETGLFRWKNPIHGHVHKNSIAGWKEKKGYISIEIRNRTYKAHRLAWQYVYDKQPLHQIDHINRDKSDNRISNLREATQYQNSGNMIRKNKSGFKGSYLQPKTGKYKAQICIDGKIIYLGVFDTSEEAHKAYASAAVEYFGQFARTA